MRALIRASVPGRLAMLAAVVLIAGLARAFGAVSAPAHGWHHSELHEAAAAGVLWLVLPVFVCILGAALLRGEHAPWSWTFARPITRTRVLGSLIALDAATVASCAVLSAFVLGGLPGAGIVGGADVPLVAVPWLGPAYAGLYLLAATAGARTPSTIRAIGVGLAVAGGLIGALVYGGPRVVAWGLEGLSGAWAFRYLAAWAPTTVGALRLWSVHGLQLAAGLCAAGAVAAGLVIAFVRTAGSVPARVPMTAIVRPGLILALLGGGLQVGAVALLWRRAPPQARVGSAALDVGVVGTPPGHVVTGGWLRYEGGPGIGRMQVGCRKVADGCAADQLGAGDYEACVGLAPRGQRARRARSTRTRCLPIELSEGQRVRVEIDLADGSTLSPGATSAR